jgi:two-component system sensor kinase FixL
MKALAEAPKVASGKAGEVSRGCDTLRSGPAEPVRQGCLVNDMVSGPTEPEEKRVEAEESEPPTLSAASVAAALRESQARLGAILRTEVDAIVVIDERGVVESVNPAVERVFQYSAKEIVGRNVSLLMPEPYRSEHDDYLSHYIETGKKKIIGVGRVVEGQRKDGTKFPAELSVSEMRLGARRMFTGIVRDVTERVQAERRVAAFGEILEWSLNEIYLFEPGTLRFLQVNRGARENIGYSDAELRKLTPVDLKPEYTEARFRKLLAPLHSGESDQVVFSTTHRRKDGTCYPVEVHLQLIDFDDARIFVAIIYDATEKNRLNQKLIEQESLAKLGEMAAVVAHEVKNPLAGIMGAARMLGKRLPAGSEGAEICAEMVSRTEDLSQVVQDILTYSRPRTPKLSPVRLAWLLDDVKLLVGHDPQFQGVELDVAPVADVVVSCDAEMLKPVFLNVLINAAQAMAGKGKVTVDVDTNRSTGRCQVRVHDSGPGIAPATIKRIFEPFFSTKGGGTGLGLPIAKRLVGLHGGALTVECPPEGGTRVTMELPTA